MLILSLLNNALRDLRTANGTRALVVVSGLLRPRLSLSHCARQGPLPWILDIAVEQLAAPQSSGIRCFSRSGRGICAVALLRRSCCGWRRDCPRLLLDLPSVDEQGIFGCAGFCFSHSAPTACSGQSIRRDDHSGGRPRRPPIQPGPLQTTGLAAGTANERDP